MYINWFYEINKDNKTNRSSVSFEGSSMRYLR